jgi:hypothetical protein
LFDAPGGNRSLAVFAAFPAARLLRTLRHPAPPERPAEFPEGVWPLWLTAFAFNHARWFGGLLLVGLLADLLLA